ncbi:MAG TPA: tetratricopeptide repeat protein [Methylomirabilota bacterium]|nr:tetratricopeptide repeat protein [Methylomirabilota bacterium]
MQSTHRASSTGLKAALIASAISFTASPAVAFDVSPAPSPSWSDQTVLQALRDGARAYYAGDTELALDGLESAAEGGHPAAQWKLGRMYADGDGVEENDLKAFEYFNQIIAAHADDAPSSPQAPYVANAFVEIGSYYMTGIDDSAIAPNAGRAREIFNYAATYFGDALAQVNLGRMYLDGLGGDRNPRLAARWFHSAAKKGQLDAQIRLGELLSRGEDIEADPMRGLMWLTIALKRIQAAGLPDEEIRAIHEQAMALAPSDMRREAVHAADEWIEEHAAVLATAID